MNWHKAFVMIDVSDEKSQKYWELVKYLEANGWEFADVSFGEDYGNK